MARGQCTFKQTDVTRLVRATVDAGIAVQRVEYFAKDGRIVIVTATEASADAAGDLDRELAEFEARNGAD